MVVGKIYHEIEYKRENQENIDRVSERLTDSGERNSFVFSQKA